MTADSLGAVREPIHPIGEAADNAAHALLLWRRDRITAVHSPLTVFEDALRLPIVTAQGNISEDQEVGAASNLSLKCLGAGDWPAM